MSQTKAVRPILQEAIRHQLANPAPTTSGPASTADRLHGARHAARCIHVRATGTRCGCPAMRGQPWCFFHDRIHTRPYEEGFPPLEDAASIQLAIMQVLDSLRRGKIERGVANSLLFGLQTASRNLKHAYGSITPTASDVVTVDPLDELHESRLNAEIHEARLAAKGVALERPVEERGSVGQGSVGPAFRPGREAP